MSRWNSLNFQDPCSLRILELTILHDYVIIVILRVLLLILYILIIIFTSSLTYKTFSERTIIETIWSITPALMLVLLVIPSIKVLYIVEDIKTPNISFKIVAHQWYWSSVSPIFINLFFLNKNNIMTTSFDTEHLLNGKTPRLLNRNYVTVPSFLHSRFLITSTDVIHSFSLPRLGLKVDALPGRINQLFSTPLRVGIFYGQCSEICGSNHSFIPITIHICNGKQYIKLNIFHSIETL